MSGNSFRRRALGHAKDHADHEPDQHEHGEDPEQKGELAEREPPQLALPQEEARLPDRPAVAVVLDDFAAHSHGRVVGVPALRVEKDRGALPVALTPRAHMPSLSPRPVRETRAGGMLRRLAVLGVLGIAAGLAVARPTTGAPSARAQAASDEQVLEVGDVVRVRGSALGCRVTRMSALPGQTVLDCRRAGPLPGTFGTFFGERKLLVVRFEGPRVAKVVFEATHKKRFRTCHDSR